MPKFWNTKNQKYLVTAGMIITAWYVIQGSFANMPQIPEFITDPLLGGIGILTVAAFLTLWGVKVLWFDY